MTVPVTNEVLNGTECEDRLWATLDSEAECSRLTFCSNLAIETSSIDAVSYRVAGTWK